MSETAEELRNGKVGRAKLLEADPDVGEGGGNNGNGRRPPPPPERLERGYGGGRMPRWAELALWGSIVLLSAMLGWFLGRLGSLRQADEEKP